MIILGLDTFGVPVFYMNGQFGRRFFHLVNLVPVFDYVSQCVPFVKLKLFYFILCKCE